MLITNNYIVFVSRER